MATLILSAVTAISAFAISPIEVAPEIVRGGLTEMPTRARYTRLGLEPISFSVNSVLPDSQSFPSILQAPEASSPSTPSTLSTPAPVAPPRPAVRALLPLPQLQPSRPVIADHLPTADPSTPSTPSSPLTPSSPSTPSTNGTASNATVSHRQPTTA